MAPEAAGQAGIEACARNEVPRQAHAHDEASRPARSHDAALREAHAQAVRAGHEAGRREGYEEGLRQGHEEGVHAGRAEGLREGRAQGAEEIRQATQRAVAEAELRSKAQHERLQCVAQHAHDAMADLLWSAQDDMVALCYETLCRIVGEHAVQPAFVRAQLAHVLAQHGAAEVVLHFHPQDAELLQSGPGTARFKAVPDPEVALGGCILKTASGALDARLETMLQACKEALSEARAAAQPQRPEGKAA
ncbi:MAG TPA: FliH/SctL family protein [Ramlibacter sp.]|nr:FliH/SctL family protein [Ramlibacter sp.]